MASRPALFGMNRERRIQQEALDPAEIARVAYALYEQRGREDGHDLEDWLKAEDLVRQQRAVFVV